MRSQYVRLIGASVAFFMASGAQGALVSVLGGQAVYDDDLGITWVANANLALTNQFGLTLSADILDDSPDTVGSTGLMTWENAQAWISGMNTANYLGFNDWRFAETLIPDDGCDGSTSQGSGCSGSEMGHLFYDEFGADPNTSVLATGNPTELAKFSNLQSAQYWSGTEFVSNTGWAYMFGFEAGGQRIVIKTENHFALAVRGDTVIPIPAGMWLFGSALGLLGWLRRKAMYALMPAVPVPVYSF